MVILHIPSCDARVYVLPPRNLYFMLYSMHFSDPKYLVDKKGTVAECLSSRVPLIFVPREGWPEEEALRELMAR